MLKWHQFVLLSNFANLVKVLTFSMDETHSNWKEYKWFIFSFLLGKSLWKKSTCVENPHKTQQTLQMISIPLNYYFNLVWVSIRCHNYRYMNIFLSKNDSLGSLHFLTSSTTHLAFIVHTTALDWNNSAVHHCHILGPPLGPPRILLGS